ncbi:SGNH/GDSL hydrolase family protein [Leptospira sanjuanensis]|uniref:hypothetical protein n=1 Tax=Leptospira sanjuanensis TaxID=2879643 RepID=UPI001EE7DB63|nr:hypothetical protein [Leptospira sanjuanensis]MCG6170247.1 hypothetical protein [Leptospira sanjuanensis]
MNFKKILKEKLEYLKTNLGKKLTYYAYVFLFHTRLRLGLPVYLYGMMKIAIESWRYKIKFRTEVPGQLMVLHYNPNAVKDPVSFVKRIEDMVVKPFRFLHRVNPVVVIIPYGSTFQAGSFKGFVRSLDRDQLQALKTALYEDKVPPKIEIISGSEAA